MPMHRALRPVIACVVFGLLLGLTGCGGKPEAPKAEAKDNKQDDKKGDTTTPPSTTTPTSTGNPPLPTGPVELKDDPELKDVLPTAAVFVPALRGGNVPLVKLTPTFLAAVGPARKASADDQKTGYASDRAADWLRRIGGQFEAAASSSPASPPQGGFATATKDVAVVSGTLGDRQYLFRLVRQADKSWKIDWVQLTAIPGTITVKATTPDEPLQQFVVQAFLAAVADSRGLPSVADRLPLAAALMTTTYRDKNGFKPRDSDTAEGYTYDPSELKIWLEKDRFAGGKVVSYTLSAVGSATFKVELALDGGAKKTLVIKLIAGPGPGQWLIDDITPA